MAREDASSTFGYAALQARIERIPREEGEQFGLPLEPHIRSVVIHKSDEPGRPADGLGRGGVDMVDIVVVEDAQIGGVGVPRAGVYHRFLRRRGDLPSHVSTAVRMRRDGKAKEYDA